MRRGPASLCTAARSRRRGRGGGVVALALPPPRVGAAGGDGEDPADGIVRGGSERDQSYLYSAFRVCAPCYALYQCEADLAAAERRFGAHLGVPGAPAARAARGARSAPEGRCEAPLRGGGCRVAAQSADAVG